MRCAVGGGIIQMWRYENIWLPQLVWGLAASGSADLVPKPNPDFILVILSLGGTLAIYLTLSSLRLGSEGEATLVERTRLGETSLLWSRPEGGVSLCWRTLGQLYWAELLCLSLQGRQASEEGQRWKSGGEPAERNAWLRAETALLCANWADS